MINSSAKQRKLQIDDRNFHSPSTINQTLITGKQNSVNIAEWQYLLSSSANWTLGPVSSLARVSWSSPNSSKTSFIILSNLLAAIERKGLWVLSLMLQNPVSNILFQPRVSVGCSKNISSVTAFFNERYLKKVTVLSSEIS